MKKIVVIVIILIAFLTIAFVAWKKNEKQAAVPAETAENIDISVCDPATNTFSLTSTNSYFPLFPGVIKMLEDTTAKVQVTVLDETEEIAGITTRVVEEKEWENNLIVETSRNYFAETQDGTVCYFGESVDMYENGELVNHEGSWRAGEGQNKPGIIMPADPKPGQTYQQEVAAPVASDSAKHIRVEESFTVPAGTYSKVLVVEENPPSTKRYAPGVGLIFDNGTVLTKH